MDYLINQKSLIIDGKNDIIKLTDRKPENWSIRIQNIITVIKMAESLSEVKLSFLLSLKCTPKVNLC